MPTYQYRCKSCKHEFDTFQSMMDSPLTQCPKCNGVIFRVIQPTQIHFKGSGFYVTDTKKQASESTTTSKKKTDKKQDSSVKKTSKKESTGDK